MESKGSASIGRRTIRHSASLRLHDPLDEVQAQTVTGNARSDVHSPIKGLEQMSLIPLIDPGAVIANREPDFLSSRGMLRRDLDPGLLASSSILKCIAEKIQDALDKRGAVCIHGRQIGIDMRRQFAFFQI